MLKGYGRFLEQPHIPKGTFGTASLELKKKVYLENSEGEGLN